MLCYVMLCDAMLCYVMSPITKQVIKLYAPFHYLFNVLIWGMRNDFIEEMRFDREGTLKNRNSQSYYFNSHASYRGKPEEKKREMLRWDGEGMGWDESIWKLKWTISVSVGVSLPHACALVIISHSTVFHTNTMNKVWHYKTHVVWTSIHWTTYCSYFITSKP